MVTLVKNSDVLNPAPHSARFARRIPSQTRFENREPSLRYKRARIYSAQLGRFISRDPLGFVDGMSLYRAYFVPSALDPEGTDWWWPGKHAGTGIGKGIGWLIFGTGEHESTGFGCCNVLIWDRLGLLNEDQGHVSISCPGMHASFHPRTPGNPHTVYQPAAWVDFPNDVKRMRREPKWSIPMCCLDQAKVVAEFKKIKASNPMFCGTDNNCVDIGLSIILAGLDSSKPNCNGCGSPVEACLNVSDSGIPWADSPRNLKPVLECFKKKNCRRFECRMGDLITAGPDGGPAGR